MKIESIIKRPNGHTIDIEGCTYEFAPDKGWVAEVEDPRHIGQILAVNEGYQPAPGESIPGDAIKHMVRPDGWDPGVRPVPAADPYERVDENVDQELDAASEEAPMLDLPPLDELDVEGMQPSELSAYCRAAFGVNPASRAQLTNFAHENEITDWNPQWQPMAMIRYILHEMQRRERLEIAREAEAAEEAAEEAADAEAEPAEAADASTPEEPTEEAPEGDEKRIKYLIRNGLTEPDSYAAIEEFASEAGIEIDLEGSLPEVRERLVNALLAAQAA